MPEWDEDGLQLTSNLQSVQDDATRAAERREPISLEMPRRWHRTMMAGLSPPEDARKHIKGEFRGVFRGEDGLADIVVAIGPHRGSEPAMVAGELQKFIDTMERAVARLDEAIDGVADSQQQILAVATLCAWAHAEWVRIHPFANGNGRTARLWANFIAMRYGIASFVRLRPRPDGRYESAAHAAMQGDWHPTRDLFLQLLRER